LKESFLLQGEFFPLLEKEGWLRRQPAGWRRRRGGQPGGTFAQVIA